MFKMSLFQAFLVCLIAVLPIQTNAQARIVKFRFEIDGKLVRGPRQPKIVIYAVGEKTELDVSDDSFIVPAQIQNNEKVSVRFTFGKYDLLFESVYLSKFGGEWVIGVDKKPFDSNNIRSAQAGKQIKQVYYINFHPLQAEETRMVVIAYKR